MEKQTLLLFDAHLNAYNTLITEWGYSPGSVDGQIRLITRFGQWLENTSTTIYSVDEVVVQRFLRCQKRAGYERRGDAAALCRFLQMLRERGATQRPQKPTLSPKQQLVANYRCYLLEERRLSQAAVVNYAPFIDRFLAARFRQTLLKLSQLRAPDVTSFVQQEVRKLCPGRAQLLVSALRSFLRYLQHRGKVTTDLAVCVPTVARWSFATLPKSLPAGDVQKGIRVGGPPFRLTLSMALT